MQITNFILEYYILVRSHQNLQFYFVNSNPSIKPSVNFQLNLVLTWLVLHLICGHVKYILMPISLFTLHWSLKLKFPYIVDIFFITFQFGRKLKCLNIPSMLQHQSLCSSEDKGFSLVHIQKCQKLAVYFKFVLYRCA